MTRQTIFATTGVLAGAVALAAVLVASAIVTPAAEPALVSSAETTTPTPARWIAAWGATPSLSQVAPAASSVRNIARLSVTGEQVRIRVANPKAGTPLVIGAATVALQKGTIGADVEPGSIRTVTFDGKPGITIPASTEFVYSDPVTFSATANTNVAVSLSLPAATNPDVGGAQWNNSYVTAANAGDQTGSEAGTTFTTTMSQTYALTAIDVLTSHADGAIVGLGSSTLHGSNSTKNGYDRVLDLFITRNQNEVADGDRKGIVGAGFGGDTLHAGVNRLQRDVLSQSGVSGVIVWDTNDLTTRSAAQIISDYKIVIDQSHAVGVEVYCPTWAPGAQSIGAREQRSILNEWIANSGSCDDTVDWDRTLRNDTTPDTYKLAFFSDGIHPNAAGHAAMSAATPLRWFTSTPR